MKTFEKIIVGIAFGLMIAFALYIVNALILSTF